MQGGLSGPGADPSHSISPSEHAARPKTTAQVLIVGASSASLELHTPDAS